MSRSMSIPSTSFPSSRVVPKGCAGVAAFLLFLSACGTGGDTTSTNATSERATTVPTTAAPAPTDAPTTTVAAITWGDIEAEISPLCGESFVESFYASVDCGLDVTVLGDGGYEVNYLPSIDSGGGSLALAIVGAFTDCWGPSDSALMEQTRALDGRLESASGRSSWSYHPDDGLNIVCSPGD